MTLSPHAYERELRPLLPRAGAYAQAILRRREDAEDAVQGAALRGLERLSTYDETRPFRGWWFAILRNQCLDQLRRAKTARTVTLEGDYPAPAEEPGFDWRRLDEAIVRLSPTHQEILRLRYFGDLSYAELAEALGVPAGTIMSRLHAARKALAGQLQEEDA
jgi:RNA polymerase sigma-70 factor (ECF subfamily)